MSEITQQFWIYWAAAAVLFAILELTVPYFGFLFAALAAVCAALVSLRTSVWEIHMAAFTFSLLIGIFLLRPKLIKKLQAPENHMGRTDQLLGKNGKVIESVDTVKGRVDVEGQDWAARSSTAIPAGTDVIVESADGIILHVRKG